MSNYPTADITLARTLESTEAGCSAEIIETRRRLFPDSAAEFIRVAGAWVLYDGPESPLTQTFGLGIFEATHADDMDRIENFYRSRGARVFHEVSPLADATTMTLLNDRGYQPFEFSSVMYQPIEPGRRPDAGSKLRARIIEPGEEELWARVAAEGWSEFGDFGPLLREGALIDAEREKACSFLAELDGEPIAAAGLYLGDEVALLAGASTIPEARRQGAQRVLLAARLHHAANHGCRLAMMCALAGSGSQRNAERNGFRIAYTRLKWRDAP